jgi:hypothetical protein
MLTREENVRRILKGVEDGTVKLEDLNAVDRRDLKAFDSLDLTEWQESSDRSGVYGDLTLQEVKKARELSKTLLLE